LEAWALLRGRNGHAEASSETAVDSERHCRALLAAAVVLFREVQVASGVYIARLDVSNRVIASYVGRARK
jgi:hypothetical protein